MLPILTNPVDGTSDCLAQIAKRDNQSIFCWHIDLWQHSEILCEGRHFFISGPTGRQVDASADQVYLLWRKLFTDLMRFDRLRLEAAGHEQARVQLGQWLQALVGFDEAAAACATGGALRRPSLTQALPAPADE